MDTGNDADGTNRQLKWFWVVFEVMTCMLQDVLWKEIRPDRLADAVMNSKPLKKRFKKLNALDKIIKAKDSQKPYEDFDISLLYVCLRNTCPKIKPKKGWEQKPKDSDTTIGDDVERIRHFRNDLVHASKVFMSAMESEENWATAVDIGRRLGEYVGRNVNYEEEIKRCQNNSITPAMKTEVTEKLERLENEVCLLKLKVTESWKLRSEASSQAERKRQNLSILQHHIVLILNETSNSIREKSKKSKIKKVLRRFKKHDDVLNQLTETPEFQDILNNLTGKILMCAKEKKNEHKIFAIYLKFLCEWERKYSCSIICSPGCISLAVNFLSIAEMDLFLSDFENGNISLDLQEVLLYPPLLSLFDLQEGDLDFRITILEEDQDEKSEENLFNERRNFQENKNWNSLDKFLHIDCKAFLRALLKHIQEEDLGIATSKESQRTKSRKDTAREKKEVENLALEECFSIFRSGVYKDFISEPKLGWESREFPRGNQTNVADDILRLFFYWEEVRSKKDMKISKAKMADVVFVLQEIAERMARIYGDLGVDLQNKVAALTDDASISEELKKTDETSVKDFGEKEDMRKYKEFFENQDLEDTNDLISFKETLQDLRHKTFRACNAELLQNYMMPMKQALEHVKRQDLEIKLYGSAERALIWIQETEKLLEVEAIEKLKGFDALRSEMDGLLRYVSSVMDQVPSEMESIKKKLRAVYSKVKLFNECISNKEERITIDIDSRGTILSSPIQGLSLQMWDNNDRNEHMPNLDRSLFQTSVTEVFRFTLQGKPYTVHSKNEDVILVRIQMINLKKPNGRQWLSKVCHRDIWTTIETQTQDDWIFFGIEALESFFIIESAEEMPMTIDPKGGVYMHVSDP
ncbi:uncharacterized protein LOC134242871 [Saccostrea cucullata]|uniref:uncharacterized protein LOC134242871 n=1 Tax=Saccostrea cuccullata TaxID=36930 RepID=UPI002ED0A6C0